MATRSQTFTHWHPGSAFDAVANTVANLFAGMIITILAAIRVTLNAGLGVAIWVPALLGFKPIIDLTWQWRFFEIAGQEVNVQTFVGLGALGLALIYRMGSSQRVAGAWWPDALAIVGVFSASFNRTGIAANVLLRWLVGLAFFFVAPRAIGTEKSFVRFSKILIISTLVPMVLGLGQFFGFFEFTSWDWIDGVMVGRVTGTYETPLPLTCLFLYTVPITLYFIDRKPGKHRIFLVGFIGFVFVIALMSYFRVGLMALVLEIVVWLMLTRGWKQVLLFLFIASLPVLFLPVFWEKFFDPAMRILHGDLTIRDPEFLRGRGIQWYVFAMSYLSGGWPVWLFGRGSSEVVGFIPGVDYWAENDAHNDFLRILHVYGAVGLLMYLAFIIAVVRKAWRIKYKKTFDGALARMCLTAFSGLMLLSLTTEPTKYPFGSWYLIAFASLVFTAAARFNQQNTDTKEGNSSARS